MAKQYFKSGSAVKHLHEAGFLALRGTSCAHTVWLDDEEFALMAETGASCVHNPLSNLRLGSGVMPVKKMLDAGVNVAMGTDGSCSSDGQVIASVGAHAHLARHGILNAHCTLGPHHAEVTPHTTIGHMLSRCIPRLRIMPLLLFRCVT
eukprot:scaffold23482_cov32-Tisochrysis_lutea.AAC.2